MGPRQYDTALPMLLVLGIMVLLVLMLRWIYAPRPRLTAPSATRPTATAPARPGAPRFGILTPLVVSPSRDELAELSVTLRSQQVRSTLMAISHDDVPEDTWGFWAGSWVAPSALPALTLALASESALAPDETTPEGELWVLLVFPSDAARAAELTRRPSTAA